MLPTERGRELDAAVAVELFGCEGLIEVSMKKGVGPYALYFTVEPPDPMYSSFEYGQRFTRDGVKVYCGKPFTLYRFPSCSSSLDACSVVEAEIERRGLVGQYVELLTVDVLDIDSTPNWDYEYSWALLRATPEQRCIAALAAVRGAKGDTHAD